MIVFNEGYLFDNNLKIYSSEKFQRSLSSRVLKKEKYIFYKYDKILSKTDFLLCVQ